jgi:hypothetical protein
MIRRHLKRLTVGGLVLAAVIGVVWYLGSRQAKVHVRNDTGTAVTITGCVETGEEVQPGSEFQTEAVPTHDQLPCLVASDSGQRCEVIPHVKSIRSTVNLSQLVVVSLARCD